MALKLRAGTLVETLIASVLIALVFSIAIISYLSILSSNKSGAKLAALQHAIEISNELVESNELISKEWSEENFSIEQIIESREDASNAYNLTLIFKNKQNTEILKWHKVITKP